MNESTLMNYGVLEHRVIQPSVIWGRWWWWEGVVEREAPITQDELLLDVTQAGCSLVGNFNLATTSHRSTCITFITASIYGHHVYFPALYFDMLFWCKSHVIFPGFFWIWIHMRRNFPCNGIETIV